MGEELFRKSALDKLASPERLDVLMEVTSPKGWLALITMGAVLAGVLVWSIFGSIPERIDGQGILIRGGGLRQLRASGDGTLVKFAVQLNDEVKVGQVVGQISQIGSAEEIKAAQADLDQAQREYETSKAEDEATIAGIESNIAGQQADLRRTQLLRQKAAEDVKRLSDSLAKGLVTRNRVEQAERDLSSQEASITGLNAQMNSLRAQIRSVQQRIRAKLDAVDQAKLKLQRMTATEKSYAEVTSTVDGRVVELKKRVGDHVANGEVVATIEPPSSAIEPIVYINSSSGKRIRPGMEAQISPTTVRREEYGFMRGEVQTVGEYPVTPDAVKSVTANDQLAQELIASGTKIEVHVQLKRDANTTSGYAWSSSGGPPFKIDGGTRLTVSVVVDRKAPISYVLPIRMFGG
ncbi:MAG: NHLP bacteriocin system secretion protein [Betaproteobacteria bacterium]